MAGRLRGSAFQLAMTLSRDRIDPQKIGRRIMTGDELLTQPAHQGFVDQQTGAITNGPGSSYAFRQYDRWAVTQLCS